MYQLYKGQGLKIFGVGVDWSQSYDCPGWAETFGVSYPILDDSNLEIISEFGFGVPWFMVLDHNMNIRYSSYGGNEAAIAQLIDELLFELPTVEIQEQYDSDLINLPLKITLHQNYPNPFNPVTTINYDLPEQSQVSINIYDVLGRELRELVNDFQNAGHKSVIWDGTDEFGRNVKTGIYLYQIQTRRPAGDFTQTRKMILLR